MLVGVFVLQNGSWIGSYLFAEREGNFLLVNADAGVVEALDSAGRWSSRSAACAPRA